MSLPPAENYFREPTASTILYIHIGFMTLAWVGALPIRKYLPNVCEPISDISSRVVDYRAFQPCPLCPDPPS